MLHRWSIRTQLLTLALAAIVPLAAVIIYGIFDTASESLEQAHRATMRVATDTAMEVEKRIAETERTLETLAARPSVRALDPKRCDPILKEMPVVFPAMKFPDFNAIGIRDASGNLVCSMIPDPASAQVVRQAPAFQKAIAGGRFDVSKGFVSPITKRWIAMSAYPIRDAGNAVAGLIFLRLDLRDLQDQVIPNPPEGVAIGVLDSNGTFLMRWPEPEKWIGKAANNRELVVRLAREKFTGIERLVGTDGVSRIYAFHPVAGTDWIVASGVPESTVFAPYRARLVQGAVTAALALLLAIALALRISGMIARPVLNMANAATRVAAGDREVRVPAEGPAEIEKVATEFNRMLEARAQADVVHATLGAIVDSADDAIVGKKLDGTIQSWNPGAARLFGYEATEIIGRNVTTLIPPDRLEEEPLIIERLMRGDPVRNFESQRLCKDGSLVDVSLTFSPIRDATGAIVGASKIARDITDRIAAEKLAKRQADFFAALSATSQAIVRMHEPEALYEEICRICVEHGGATMAFIALVRDGHAVPVAWSSLIGDFLPGIVIPLAEDAPGGQGPIATAVRTGRPYICNDIYTDPRTEPWRERSSSIGTLSTAALPIRRGGAIAGVLSLHVKETGFFTPELVKLLEEMAGDLAFGLDNHDRIAAQAEASLQEWKASERFRKIFDSSPLATCVIRAADARFVAANAAYCKIFGHPHEALMGRTAIELGIWADPAQRGQFITRLQADRHVREFPAQVRTGDGRTRDTLVSAELIEFMDEPCILIQNMDVTERKKAEDLLRNLNATLERRVAERTAELEGANRELDSFARTIAHDLRAPLRSISRFNAALRNSLSEDSANTSYSDRITKNVARMDNMLTDLLEFARSGRTQIAEIPLDMQSLASGLAEELAVEATPRPEIVIGELPRASGDLSLLRQVWANLISNAIKYSSKVAHPHIEIGARRGEVEIEYFVRDNGCGFDPAYADKLFEVFQRLHTEAEYEGNGIGLAIVHRIVERHGGRVSSRSKPGEGAEFSFTLPLRTAS